MSRRNPSGKLYAWDVRKVRGYDDKLIDCVREFLGNSPLSLHPVCF